MMKTVSLFSLLILASSCGQPSSNYKSQLEKVIFTNYTNETTPLKKQINSCDSSSFDQDQKELSFNIRLEDKVISRTENFSSLLKGNYLRDGKVISAAVFGEEVEIIRGRGYSQEKTLTYSKHINFCSSETSYDEDSVENAALSTSFFIRKTYDKVTEVLPELNISPIRLNISPSIILSVVNSGTKESRYWADNALYLPSIKTIVFLPSSKDSYMKTDFWQIPMVASHEYGHHIFNNIYPVLEDSSAHHNCFGQHSQAKSEWSNDRKITRQTVLSSLNEGFADLISYYTLDSSELGIKGVTCLDTSRDVSSSKLIDGRAKKFHQQAVSMFFDSSFSYIGTCEYPSFQEIHIFGATFAYTADAFMNSLGATKEQKLEAIVEWLQFVNKNKQRYTSLSPKSYFNVLYSQFITITLNKFNSDFNTVTCAKIKELAPAIEFKKCEGI